MFACPTHTEPSGEPERRTGSKILAALAFLVAAFCDTDDRSKHDRLSASTLAKVAGRDIFTAQDQDSCAGATIGAGEVTFTSCNGQPNGTVCLKCQLIQSLSSIPNTTGSIGHRAAGGAWACTNWNKIQGTCQANLCAGAVPNGKCKGTPTRWEVQPVMP